MPDTPHLDKIIALARPYERVEHGREEHVGGYMSKLRDLAGGVPGHGAGVLSESDYTGAQDDLARGMEPGRAASIQQHIEQGHAAFKAGDYNTAHSHMVSARNDAIYGGRSGAGRAQRVIRAAEDHMRRQAASAFKAKHGWA